MKHTENKFTIEGLGELYYQGWLPDGDVKAVLFIAHGLAEHGGRYINLVNQVVPLGFAVYAMDQYGHGRSDGERVYINRFEDYIHPLKTFLDMVAEWHPGKKVFLMGHSMGGLIAAVYLLDHQEDFAGAIISAPLTKIPSNINAFSRIVVQILANVIPKARLVGVDSSGISRDPDEVARYVNDPLVYTGNSTTKLGAETLRAMEKVTAGRAKISLPILIVQGGADPLVDLSGAQELYDAISSEDKTLKYYDGYYHEMINDIGKEVVLEDLCQWLEAHL
ncbi:MAG: lysophospholipase [Anaerolineales bacterium]